MALQLNLVDMVDIRKNRHSQAPVFFAGETITERSP